LKDTPWIEISSTLTNSVRKKRGVIVDYVAVDSYGGVLILHVQLQANLRL